MSTIDSREIIFSILKHKGLYPGDKPVRFVFTYTNFEGAKTYAVTDNRNEYLPTEYVRDPILLMQDGVFTLQGKEQFKQLERFIDMMTPAEEEDELP